jgi:hypothetical protein
MDDDRRRGKDEMNLSVLPIARLGSSDKRTKLEYYGTFAENGEQKDMVWIVEGGASGLPTELAERVLIALLFIGSKENFKNRKMTFTVYRVLKTMGLTINPRNYREIEKALKRLVAVTVFTDQAWYNHERKTRITANRGFHIIDEYYLHYEEGADEGEESFVIWGSRMWSSIQAGYLKYLDLDFYYSISTPLARRMFRFLDKVMAYQDTYQIDIFALANKLGMTPYEYSSHLKRPLKKAAEDLVKRGWLADFEFIKVGNYHRMCFYKGNANKIQLQLFSETTNDLITVATNTEIVNTPHVELWKKVCADLPKATAMLDRTMLIDITNGIATIVAGSHREWLENRMKRAILRAFQLYDDSIVDVRFQ